MEATPTCPGCKSMLYSHAQYHSLTFRAISGDPDLEWNHNPPEDPRGGQETTLQDEDVRQQLLRRPCRGRGDDVFTQREEHIQYGSVQGEGGQGWCLGIGDQVFSVYKMNKAKMKYNVCFLFHFSII